MMETEPLFPEIAIQNVSGEILPPRPNACGEPFSLLAYWPRGGYWKIHYPLGFFSATDARIRKYAEDLQAKGWTHIHIMRLPSLGPWAEK